MKALFYKMSSRTYPSVWVFDGTTDDEDRIAKFVRDIENDIKATADMEVKTLRVKIVDLDAE